MDRESKGLRLEPLVVYVLNNGNHGVLLFYQAISVLDIRVPYRNVRFECRLDHILIRAQFQRGSVELLVCGHSECRFKRLDIVDRVQERVARKPYRIPHI